MKVGNFILFGKPTAPILVVVDHPSEETFKSGLPLPKSYFNLFKTFYEKNGFSHEDFCYITPCPPFPPGISELKAKQTEHLKKYRAQFLNLCSKFKGKAIVAFGAQAAQQLLGKPVKITRVRGIITPVPDLKFRPMVAIMSPGQVLRQPRHELSFRADFEMVRQLRDAKFVSKDLKFDVGQNYRWVNGVEIEKHILESIANRKDPSAPLATAMDTETVGGQWYQGAIPIMAQLSFKAGEGVAIPLSVSLCARVLAAKIGGVFEYPDGDPWRVKNLIIKKPAVWQQCIAQAKNIVPHNKAVFKRLMEQGYHPIVCTGQNFKYDIHVCYNAGIYVDTDCWEHDTMQLAFVADENIQSKDLASLTKIWVPPLSGYSDEFEATVDYAHMDQVEHTKIMHYGVADTDTTLRLTKRLVPMCMQDERQYNCYERVQMPALRMFVDVERRGTQIDLEALRALGTKLTEEEEAQYQELIGAVHPDIRLKHLDIKNKNRYGLNFSRKCIVIDQLFEHEKGLKLEPKLYTPTGLPSCSTKHHMPYFEDEPWVSDFIQWEKINTLLGKFVGKEEGIDDSGDDEEASGIWEYINEDGCIRPSYMLHRTVTGRTASNSPNGQNFPKHGELAQAYRKIFVPHKGYSFIEVDLSQAELRIAAWQANEKNMIALFNAGEDIHAATGAAIIGITLQKFKQGRKSKELLNTCANNWPGCGAWLQKLSPGKRATSTVSDYLKHVRQCAKAVGFGFLYGMWWKKFISYAKTTYKVTVTEAEAQKMRETFFKLYPDLVKWHEDMKSFVNENGYVRSIHGAVRHLQDIYSVDEKIRMATERQSINSPVQRFASDIALMGAIRFHRDMKRKGGDDAFITAFIHDAIIVEVKKGKEKEFASYLKWYFESVPLQEWFGVKAPIPILADVKCAPDNLGEAEEWEDTIAKKPAWFTSDSDSYVAPVKKHSTPSNSQGKAFPVTKSATRLRGDDEDDAPAFVRVPFKRVTKPARLRDDDDDPPRPLARLRED